MYGIEIVDFVISKIHETTTLKGIMNEFGYVNTVYMMGPSRSFFHSTVTERVFGA